jgi:hypothetical protein
MIKIKQKFSLDFALHYDLYKNLLWNNDYFQRDQHEYYLLLKNYLFYDSKFIKFPK